MPSQNGYGIQWRLRLRRRKKAERQNGRRAEGRKGKLKSPFRGFRGKKAKGAKTFHEPSPGCKPGKLNSHCFQTVAANGESRNGKGKLKSPIGDLGVKWRKVKIGSRALKGRRISKGVQPLERRNGRKAEMVQWQNGRKGKRLENVYLPLKTATQSVS